MKRSMTILYKVYNGLYVNLTNRCSSACSFCLRQFMDGVGEGDNLWLEHEPEYEEVIEAFSGFNMDEFDELVFCGFGEPTMRFDLLIRVAKYVKEHFDIPVRINTNGQGNLINNRNIAPEMKGLIDTVSISLNTSDPEKYNALVRSVYGDKAFDAMLGFAEEAKKYVPKVVLTTVDTTISKEDEEACLAICEKLGVTYRIRPCES